MYIKFAFLSFLLICVISCDNASHIEDDSKNNFVPLIPLSVGSYWRYLEISKSLVTENGITITTIDTNIRFQRVATYYRLNGEKYFLMLGENENTIGYYYQNSTGLWIYEKVWEDYPDEPKWIINYCKYPAQSGEEFYFGSLDISTELNIKKTLFHNKFPLSINLGYFETVLYRYINDVDWSSFYEEFFVTGIGMVKDTSYYKGSKDGITTEIFSSKQLIEYELKP